MDEQDREDQDFVVLTDENGEEHRFELLDVISVDANEYAVLADPDSENEAFVLRIDTDAEGNETLSEVQDEEEWKQVAEAWERLQDEDWDEEDEDDEEWEEEFDADYEDEEEAEDDLGEEEDEDEEGDDGKGPRRTGR
jgi:putative Holliday junction resolvase